MVLEPNKLDLVKIHHIDRFIRDDMLKISADETVALTTNTRNSIVVWLLGEATVKGEGGEVDDGEKVGSSSNKPVRKCLLMFSILLLRNCVYMRYTTN